eukprot:TRINITY_DN1592_c0_g1_i3.p3 TRINITY_DN1592_c0_g1~~TRINITY_DN1592_c0_g1_i3.p3  ORF type:complete len:110 (-),score=19.33 TRINITY_DN1592_c0_g1_i3:79-408(-)
MLLDIFMPPHQNFVLPLHDMAAFLYILDGECSVAGKHTGSGTTAVLDSIGKEVMIETGRAPVRIFLSAAKPIGEPIVQYGPFVMAHGSDVQKAINDFRSGDFIKPNNEC